MKKILLISTILLLTAYKPVKYEVYCNKDLFYKSLDTAISQNGVTEKTNNNDGEPIELYLRSIGLNKGNPYCAAGQFWAFQSACRVLNLSDTAIPIKRTGSTVAMFDHAKKYGVQAKYVPKIGDLIFWRLGEKYSGHVERVIEVLRANKIKTIAFNTSNNSNNSQRDGGGVFIKTRSTKNFLGQMQVRGLIGFRYE